MDFKESQRKACSRWGWVERRRLRFRLPVLLATATPADFSLNLRLFTASVLPVSPNRLKAQLPFEVDLLLSTSAVWRC